MDVSTATTDVADVDRSALEVRPTSATLTSAADAFDSVVPAAAWDAMQRHARVRLDVEVGGVLIGKVVAVENGTPYLLIEAGIPAAAAESRETNITFTAEAWTHIHEVIDRDHPGAAIVGWYHTHPNFGIFLSEMDLFIQHHFFDLPHHVAIVIDPVAGRHGCFAWRRGTPTLGPLLIETPITPSLPPPQSAAAAPAESSTPADEPHNWAAQSIRRSSRHRVNTLLDPLARLEASQWAALFALLAIATVLFGALATLWLDDAYTDSPQSTTTTFTAPQGTALP